MRSAWIGLGGNVGEVRANLTAALVELSQTSTIEAVSPLYETPPWGPIEQPRFLNACAHVRTDLSPADLLGELHRVEKQLHRTRIERWGPRTVDLDLLAYENFHSDDEALTIPHPRMCERAFVLVPLADIAPDLVIAGRSVAAHARRIERGDMRIVSRHWYGSAAGAVEVQSDDGDVAPVRDPHGDGDA